MTTPSESSSQSTSQSTSQSSDEALNARHAEKMRKRKAARDKILAEKTIEKGLIVVHTGKGKGKSTAAFGMAFRSLGRGMPVAIVQFIKGAWETGEAEALKRFDDLASVFVMGEGFTWETQDRERDIAAAGKAWDKAKELILDDEHQLVILDELNIALRYDYVSISEVVSFLRDHKPADKHVVITGRNAKDELIEIADLVTDMTLVKHPFRDGVKAQPGIEF